MSTIEQNCIITGGAVDVQAMFGEIIATFTIPAITEKFVAKDKFKVGIGKKSEVKISHLGNNFRKWFLEKEEDPFVGSSIYGRQLKSSFTDGSILKELNGYKKAEITLSEICVMLEDDSHLNGEIGVLSNDGRTNIFYVRDINHILRVVSIDLDNDGWHVNAFSVVDRQKWRYGVSVFSRNFLPSNPA